MQRMKGWREGSPVPTGAHRGGGGGGCRGGIYVFNLTPYDQLSSPAEKSAGQAISIAR